MLLKDWIAREGRGSRERLAREAGVSRMTIKTGEDRKISRVDIARRISDATKGEVTVEELHPLPEQREPTEETRHSEPSAA